MQLSGSALEVAESYRETLSKLTFNNKLVINTLTEIANENKAFARDIVGEIEKRIHQVTADQMLPLMYLTDSICKNHGSPYKELFQEKLVANFSYIFMHVSEKVRSSLYKLRSTWGDKYQVFSDVMLCELDKKVKKIDPAWPVSEPKGPAQTGSSRNIHVNPGFFPGAATSPDSRPRKSAEPEDETERMRAELLRKEKELIDIKRKLLDVQIAEARGQMNTGTTVPPTANPISASTITSSTSSTKKVDSKSSVKKEDDSRVSRDPRRRAKDRVAHKSSSESHKIKEEKSPEEKSTKKSTSPKSSSKGSTPPPPLIREDPEVKNKSDKSPSKKHSKSESSKKESRSSTSSSSHKSESHKSSSSDKKSSNSSKSSSRSSDKKKDRSRTSSPEKVKIKEEPKEKTKATIVRKRGRDSSPSLSPSPTRDQRTSPPMAKQQSLPRIPKVPKTEVSSGFLEDVDAIHLEAKRSRKRHHKDQKESPPDKKKKERSGLLGPAPNLPPLHIDPMSEGGNTDAAMPSPSVGWAVHKQDHPDQFRTPVKEEDPFFEPDGRNNWNNDQTPERFSGRRRGRDNFNNCFDQRGVRVEFGRGGRGRDNRNRNARGWMPQHGNNRRGNNIRGGFHPDQGFQGPFPGNHDVGFSGTRFPGPAFNNGMNQGPEPPFPQGMLPNLENDLDMMNPENVRKEVIPNLIKMAEDGRANGRYNEIQFRNLMQQVLILKEASLVQEAKRRSETQENKENRVGGWSGPNQAPSGPRPGPDAGPGPNMVDGNDRAPVDKPPYLLDIKVSPPSHLTHPEPASASSGVLAHKNDLPMADATELEVIQSDPTKTLNIDDCPRQIRYYGETATIVMGDDKVCELSFQPETEQRRIVIDDTIVVFADINANRYTEFMVDGVTHTIKIGSPTRELWIDSEWHECYFKQKIRVRIGSALHTVVLEGDPPAVAIGDPRPDLCPGYVHLIIDGNPDLNASPRIFLDAKSQLVEIAGKPHILKFVERYQKITINGHPFRADFGGFPMVVSVMGRKHFLRLTSLPGRVVLPESPGGRVSPSGPRKGPRVSPNKHNEAPRQTSPLPPPLVKPPPLSPNRLHPDPSTLPPSPSQLLPPSPDTTKRSVSPPSTQEETSQDGIGLHDKDQSGRMMNLLSQIPSTSSEAVPTSTNYSTSEGASSPQSMTPAASTPVAAPAPEVPNVDINQLLDKIRMFGNFDDIFNKPSSGGIPGIAPATPVAPTPPAPVKQVEEKGPRKRLSSLSSGPIIKEIKLQSHHASLKERQSSLISALYGSQDMQCKSCGLRYSTDEMAAYTSHLDWHFRIKRREKDNARKAQSRRWYFEKIDWIVCDEIEDEDADMTEEELKDEEDIKIETLPIGAEQVKDPCPVCMEQFDQFFKQEDGEDNEDGQWHLHNAVKMEDVVYHPECYKDHQKKMERDEQDAQDASNVEEVSDSTAMEVEDVKVEEPEVKEDIEEEAVKEQDHVGDKIEEAAEVKMETDEEKTEEVEAKSEDEPKTEIKTELSETSEKSPKSPASADGKVVRGKSPMYDKILSKIGIIPEDEAMEEDVNTNEEATADVKVEGDIKEEVKEEEVEGEEGEKEVNVSLDKSLVCDGAGEGASLAAPTTQHRKVDIKMKINTDVSAVERRESVRSSVSEDDSEFDPVAIVVPAPTEEQRDAAKPRLKGRKLNQVPAQLRDSELSGLCSIM